MDSLIMAAAASLPVGAASSQPAATMAFEYNPTSDANLTLVGNAVSSATDMTGNSRAATNGSANRPDRLVAGINGVNVFDFDGANNETLNVQNALSVFNNVPAIGMDGVILIPSFAATYNVLKIFASVTTNNRFTVQILTSGKIRVSTRRIGADTTVNTDSAFSLNAGVQSYMSVQVDYVLGTVRFQIDDNIATVAINGAQTWSNGLGFTENVNSTTAPIFGRVSGGAVLNGKVGSLRAWTGRLTEAQFATQRAAMMAQFDTPQKTLAIVNPASNSLLRDKVFPSVGGFADGIPITVNVLTGPDVDVTYRLLNQLTGAVGVSTTTLGTTVGGTLSTVINDAPAGAWFAEVRASGQPDYEAVLGTNRIGVGLVGAHTGQSWERKPGGDDGRYAPYASPAWPITLTQNQTGPVTIHQRFTREGYFIPTQGLRTTQNNTGTNEAQLPDTPLNFGSGGNGLTVFCLELSQLAGGIPISPVWVPIGSSPLAIWLPGGIGYEYMNTSLTQTNGPQWEELQYVSWNGGQTDAATGVSGATMKTTMETVFANYRAMTGNPNLPILVAILGPIGTNLATNEAANGVRQAQLEVIDNDPNTFIYCSTLDLILGSDNLHLQTDQWVIQMTRAAWNIAYYVYGFGTHGAAGPKISGGSAAPGGNSATYTVTHDGGTTLKDSSGSTSGTGLTQFGSTVQVNGIDRNIVTIGLNAGTIVVTFDGDALIAGDVVGIRHQYGANPSNVNCVLDDTVNSVVLQPTRGWFTVTAA